MYAIVEIAGLQYKVEQDQQLYVNRLKGEAGETIVLDKVLLTDNGSVTVGAPVIDGLTVEAKIVEHVKGDKVVIFKKKRRKGYKKKTGFRASLTKIEILSIGGVKGEKPAKKAKATPAKSSAKVKKDDLTIVEGIGPKVQELFNENGISTLEELAAKKSEELKAILEPKGGIYAAMDTETWPKQAQMAAEGKIEELKAWQDELKGGK
ncbi:50S ribosomal protein L21 [Ornithobacterium rhinotracheale]|uniref:50S ribosomal protein L21 n=1 Tax=Ornithobacterium rhinotracheale TaxID=28251 RepID=UPI0004F89296|nr:50S ribosomal protein L21 [Ornithobacterium rhinotracheale]AIP99852.1 50S ribosomal protein L21 [Ornithobacterium rhinotracheale ORT-UMN 88]KGB66042.1 50S ribosomal protein L21 [Ornithobacterium rhinotracheale H06-030791]MBN3661721.1 50S ribosomal protein L21 [Ornithobacterium rhinotracheale]MCK0193628.1 50S ribosomal protein L21 [Ornithobacterium rhinotracheale]UOH63681.1 50S ribosomal protein L21 [Ornithobacterium rhinotracheale]